MGIRITKLSILRVFVLHAKAKSANSMLRQHFAVSTYMLCRLPNRVLPGMLDRGAKFANVFSRFYRTVAVRNTFAVQSCGKVIYFSGLSVKTYCKQYLRKF